MLLLKVTSDELVVLLLWAMLVELWILLLKEHLVHAEESFRYLENLISLDLMIYSDLYTSVELCDPMVLSHSLQFTFSFFFSSSSALLSESSVG